MNFQTFDQEQTQCDREPIHQIGAVQDFGALIAVDAGWRITHRSANCAAMLRHDAAIEVGEGLGAYLTAEAIVLLQAALGKIAEDDAVERLFGVALTGDAALFDCAIHASGHTSGHTSAARIIIEFEPHAAAQFQDHLAAVTPIMAKLTMAKSIDELCAVSATQVRQMLGFDRVMIYRFHSDDSGEVVAEEKRDDLQSYLGLRYPKTDIPQQARALFLRNRFRIIADIEREPVDIEAGMGEDEALDLSMSTLRAQAPVHVQYLKNMGVGASLSIAIARQGKLWGLIACHHSCAKLIPYSQRTVAEMLSHMFSMTLDRLLIERSETLRARSQDLHDMLIRRLAEGSSFVEDLERVESILGDVIAHDGASVLVHDDYRSHGASPTREQFLALLPALQTAPDSPVLAASSLSDHIAEAADFADTATGALILPISRPARDYLVLWRKPLIQTVHWAGEPGKAVMPGTNGLEPRSSFAAWAETIEGHSEAWSDSDLALAESLRTTLLEVILRMTDEVASERKRAREQQDLLIAELNHRVRNILNLIRSLVSQSTKDAVSIEDFAGNIGGRISALAKAHDNITRQNWSPAPLATLFESEMEAYLSGKKDRLRIVGEPVLIRPEAYTVLALVVHELVTNSAKYGSLCDSKGSIDVAVGYGANGDLMINWTERGGPPVQPPTRRGFGSTIITRIIPHDLRGKAQLNFKLSGLEAEFRVPARYIALPRELDAQEAIDDAAQSSEQSPQSAKHIPAHVLLVEDNMIIALDTEDGLQEAGVKSVDVESSVSGALASIEKREPDFAIIDFNLGTESSAKVADELARRGVRFVLATGYSELTQDLDELGAEGLMRKPYGKGEIEQALLGELAR